MVFLYILFYLYYYQFDINSLGSQQTFVVLDLRIYMVCYCVCVSFHTHIHTLGELQKKRGPEPRTDYPQWLKTLNYKTTMNVKHKMICYTNNNWGLSHCQQKAKKCLEIIPGRQSTLKKNTIVATPLV